MEGIKKELDDTHASLQDYELLRGKKKTMVSHMKLVMMLN
jgi:hypothetical protein